MELRNCKHEKMQYNSFLHKLKKKFWRIFSHKVINLQLNMEITILQIGRKCRLMIQENLIIYDRCLSLIEPNISRIVTCQGINVLVPEIYKIQALTPSHHHIHTISIKKIGKATFCEILSRFSNSSVFQEYCVFDCFSI